MNQVVLPQKLKAVVIKGISDSLQKRTVLESLQFNIFKGLVLRGITVYDGDKELLKIKEASCTFLIWPFFKKQIIVPALKVRSPVLFLERRQDGSFNVSGLFSDRPAPGSGSTGFKLLVPRVSITGGKVDFCDNTCSPAFSVLADKVNLSVFLSLPAKIKFNLQFEARHESIVGPAARVVASGEYVIADKALAVEAAVKGLVAGSLNTYCRGLGVCLTEGSIDATANIRFKDNVVSADLNIKPQQISFVKDGVSGRIVSAVRVDARYGPDAGKFDYSADMGISDADIKFGDSAAGISSLNGALKLRPDHLAWENINFKYADQVYMSSGELTNFNSPQVQLRLGSDKLTLESAFTVAGKKLTVSSLNGRYAGSEFSCLADLDFSEPSVIETSASYRMNVNLDDIREPLRKHKEMLDKINLRGILAVEGRLDGNIKDIKSCFIEAGLSSGSVGFYGLKSGDFVMHYTQDNGIADIPTMRMALYDGFIEASAKMNLKSENLPYWISAGIEGVKIEKLKNDTALASNNIAGSIKAQVKINGFSNDLSKLSGAGAIAVTEGKLWELNFFKGIGALLFTSDFTNVMFSEGSCGFVIQNEYVSTDSIKMQSQLMAITGQARIGFNGSLEAELNTEVMPDAPLTGTIKDFTTAILGQATKVGVIRVSGTLKEPKFKFKTAVVDIIKTFKDVFLGNGK